MGGIREIIFSYLRGSADPGQVVVAAQAAHARLLAERAAAQDALASIAGRRRELLLADADDAAVNDLEIEADRHRLAIERLDLLEPEILNKLQNARTAQRRAEWQMRHQAHYDAAIAFAKGFKSTCDLLDALLATAEDVRRAGFENELAATLATVPRLLTQDMGERFHAETMRLHDAELARQEVRAASPASIAAPVVAAAPAAGPIPLPDQAKAVSTAAPVIQASPKPARAPIIQTAAEGEVLVRILRDGLETAQGLQCANGDMIAVSPNIAREIVRNGAGEFEAASGPVSEGAAA